ncbi:hypothetical protein EGJ86_12260 [Pseudomonas sp. o96-267]|nr:hypothetical protein EGJ86_12260 [Pseudomonas sp. o96-267]
MPALSFGGLLRVGHAALRVGSDCSFTTVNSASSPPCALPGSSSQDYQQNNESSPFWGLLHF